MGNFAKKIKLNKVLLVDKQKIETGKLPKGTKPLNVKQVRAAAAIDRRTDHIPQEDLGRVIRVARAHAAEEYWENRPVDRQRYGAGMVCKTVCEAQEKAEKMLATLKEES